MPDETRAGSTDPAEPETGLETDSETQDVEAHGIEVEDDTEAAVFDVNFG